MPRLCSGFSGLGGEIICAIRSFPLSREVPLLFATASMRRHMHTRYTVSSSPNFSIIFGACGLNTWSRHVPNCYIIFDVDSATGLARAKGRQDGSTHFDDRELAFHERIRAGYSRFVNSSESHIPHAIINANLPLLE